MPTNIFSQYVGNTENTRGPPWKTKEIKRFVDIF